MDQPTIAAETPAAREMIAETEPHTMSPSKRTTLQIVSVALLGLAVFSVVYALGPSVAPPKLLEIEPSPLFTCKARTGDVVVAEFTLKNVTSSPVKLLGAQSGCSCTASEGLPLDLASGQTGKVRLRVHVGKFDKTNMFTKSAELFTNRDGTVPPLVVQVSASDPQTHL